MQSRKSDKVDGKQHTHKGETKTWNKSWAAVNIHTLLSGFTGHVKLSNKRLCLSDD